MTTTARAEILLVPLPHAGHLFPFAELSSKLALKDLKITILYPSSSDPPSSLLRHPLIHIRRFPLAHATTFDPNPLESLISRHVSDYIDGHDGSTPAPRAAIVDDLLPWLIDSLSSRGIPTVAFSTTSASSCALDHALADLPRGEILSVEGLPDMRLTSSVPRPGAPKWRPGPPPGKLAAVRSAVALLFNTCRDLERPFLEYLAREAKKPVWAVGPLLRSESSEPEGKDREVIQWLDLKQRGSVIYVSFGSLVTPSDAELGALADGLVESDRDFVWVTKSDRVADRLAGTRGLVVKGWAPQLAILSHPSTGGIVCHCGWNSTLEALGSGVPMLTWPVRGDQFLNAKLVTDFLKVGIPLKEADVEVKRGDVVGGIERLVADVDIKMRAESLKSAFADGFPKSSLESLEQLKELVTHFGSSQVA